LRYAAVPVFHPIVEVESRDGPQRLVVKRIETQNFTQIIFEAVQLFQLGGERGLSRATGNLEEFLKSRVDQLSDSTTNPHSGPFGQAGLAVGSFFDQGRAFAAAHFHSTAVQRDYLEARFAEILHSLIESDGPRPLASKEHSASIISGYHTGDALHTVPR